MKSAVVVDAVRIGFEHTTDISRQVLRIACVDGFPDAKKMDQIVRRGCPDPFARGKRAAARQRSVLDRGKIILAMRVGEPERDIGVAHSQNMRYTEAVTP